MENPGEKHGKSGAGRPEQCEGADPDQLDFPRPDAYHVLMQGTLGAWYRFFYFYDPREAEVRGPGS